MNRALIVFIVLSLMLPVLATACGNGGGNGTDSTPTPVQTANATSTATPASGSVMITATPSPGGAVKVGAITAWSGPMGTAGFLADQVMAVVNKKVKDRGGILGGRDLKLIKYDSRGATADAVAGATKLVKEDNVCALAWGGVTPGEFNAVATLADELKVLFTPIASPFQGRLENELKYTILASAPSSAHWTNKINLIINKLKPQTLAFLYNEDTELDSQIDLLKNETEPAGIKTVYVGLVPNDALDMTSYLTKIKYENPDVLVLGLMTSQAMTAAKQISELGGWNDIQVIGIPSCLEAAKLPGSRGWIIETGWVPGSDYPASLKFEEDFKAANGGKAPTINHMWFYTSLWTLIEAIEQAGTNDRVTVAQFARSGNLQWDTPVGMARFTADGNSGLELQNVRILEGGKVALLD